MKRSIIIKLDIDEQAIRNNRRHKTIDRYMESVLDERQDVQKKTFTKWINAHLSKTTCSPVKDLFMDLRDGHKLLALLEVLTNAKYKREKGRMRVHHINNLNKALQVLQENGVKLLNISSEDIVAGNTKLTLGLIWLIALSFDGQKLVNSQTVNGLEKNLLNWVRQFTEPNGVKVNDFSNSWSDGLAFLYVLNGHVPNFNLNETLKLHPIARMRTAFDLASRHLQIDSLLDPEDVNTNKPDKKSIVMYVLCLFHAIDARKMDMGSVHELTQFYGSTDEIQLLEEEERDISGGNGGASSGNGIRISSGNTDDYIDDINILQKPFLAGNITQLDEISLVKSTENLMKEISTNKQSSPIQRSATFTISKNISEKMDEITEEQLMTSVSIPTTSQTTTIGINNLITTITTTTTVATTPFETPRSRPISTATNVSIEISGYQNAIEMVLTLLLDSEEILSRDIPVVTDLIDAKKQFEEHEEFMIKLSEYQQHVGSALEEGARLIAESQQNYGLSQDDQNEIKQQMVLLNERWETLRMRALDVQSHVHCQLAKVQLNNIEELRRLLTQTEDRISRMEDVSYVPDVLKSQLTEQTELDRSLEDLKNLVDGLSNLVVIVNDDSFNELEDKLNALGERWGHVLKWKKNRSDKLEEANQKWIKLTNCYKIICRWMDARENDLKTMERDEISEIGSVMKRMNDLKYCAKDLDILGEYLDRLEQTADELKPATNLLLENLENLCDRSDALKQILEIQQSRIEAMGFNFVTTTTAATSPSMNNRGTSNGTTVGNSGIIQMERPESWYDFQGLLNSIGGGTEDIDEQILAEMSPQSSKKRKLQKPDDLRELEMKIQEMEEFINHASDKLTVVQKCESQQKSIILNYLSDNITQKIDELIQMKHFFEICKKNNSQINLSNEEQQISDICSKYDEINFKIEDLLIKQKHDLDNEQLYTNLTSYKLVLADCRDWFTQNANKASIEDLQNRLTFMESHTPELKETHLNWTTKAMPTTETSASTIQEWKNDFDQFLDSWLDMKSAISRHIEEKGGVSQDITVSSSKTKAEKEDISEFRQNLEYFISEVEELYVILSEMTIMIENLEKLEELKKKYAERQDIYIYLCENASQSSENDDLAQVWEKLPKLINDRIIKQTAAIENLNHFTGEYDLLTLGLKKLEQHLKEDIFLPGDIDALQKISKKYENYEKEIKKCEIDLISIRNFSEIIVKDSEDDHKTNLLNKIRNLNDAYVKCIDTFQSSSKRLHQVITQTEDILQRVEQTELWLNDLEMNTPKNVNNEIKNSNELFQIKIKFQTLKETCEQRTVQFRELNEVGSEMLLQIDDMTQHKENHQKYSTLAKQFTKLNARWNDVTALVYNRTALLEHISSQLGEFKTHVVSETGYLDKLEKCLRKSPENAADAEEIYEELDDLENTRRNHSDERLEKIQEIGAELIEHEIMIDSIRDEVQRCCDRWNLLQHQAKQREQVLQQAVSEAQTSESRITSVQNWISRVDDMLKEHEENDTTMDDLPHDFQRLIEEFKTNEELLKLMRQEVEQHQKNGKVEAANRLKDQVNLLEERFNICQKKFNNFTSPYAGFENRLNRALGELRNVERNSCILDVGSAGPSNVQDQYQHCLKMYRTLSEIKSEIEMVIKTGRKVCEDKSTKNPKKLGQSIDALKHLYNALGEHVTQSKITLEKLLKLSNSLTENFNRIERLCDQQCHAAQSSLSSSLPTTDNDDSTKMIESLLNDCNVLYDEYQKTCEPTYLEDTRNRIDDLSGKFLQSTNGEVMKQLTELKSTLHNLDNISLDKLRNVEKDLKSVDTSNSMVQALHQQVTEIVKDAISSKIRQLNERSPPPNSSDGKTIDDHQDDEIVIVSDTVRQRRSRTPSANDNGIVISGSSNDSASRIPVRSTTTTTATSSSSPSSSTRTSSSGIDGNDADNINNNDDLPPPPPSPIQKSIVNQSPPESPTSDEIKHQSNSSNVLPDLLPTTFRLAETSSLFSQISESTRPRSVYEYDDEPFGMEVEYDLTNQQFSVVEVKESNLTPKMSIHMNTNQSPQQQQQQHHGEIVNTISILESVDIFEPEYVETVNIIDASEASDSDTGGRTTPTHDGSIDDLVEVGLSKSNSTTTPLRDYIAPELKKLPQTILLEKQRLNDGGNANNANNNNNAIVPSQQYQKERDLLKDFEDEDRRRIEEKLKSRKSLVPNLKEILCTPERDSFYNSDKENNDEPLIFSEDEDIPRFSQEMAPADGDSDSDTSRIETPNSTKPDTQQTKVITSTSLSTTTTPTTPTATNNSYIPILKKNNQKKSDHILSPLEQRVYDFDKTAKYMIKKLIQTREQIEKCSDGPSAIEHLKLTIAPDAATLISQGDTLVLETHGKSTELSSTVMQSQSLLREKFREMKHAQMTKLQKSSQSTTTSPEINNKDKTKIDKHNLDISNASTKSNGETVAQRQKQLFDQLTSGENDIDNLVAKIVDEVRSLIEEPFDDTAENDLANRIRNIRERQQDLKLAIDIASQVTSPSPKAKSTMDSLEQARQDLSTHCDTVVTTLADLNRNVKKGSTPDSTTSVNKFKQPYDLSGSGEKRENFGDEINDLQNRPSYIPGSFSSKSKEKFFASPVGGVGGVGGGGGGGNSSNDSGDISIKTPSFDKSVLQISDWLNLEQDMLKKHTVDVADIDAISIAVDKQKDVLRELEFKKPQLDELVHTAENLKTEVNRKQLQSKVTRLREHWDETSQCVLQRKSQLTSMLGDSQRYEAKRLEIEAWLSRMENRSERMGSVATTADVLEAQQKEQKSFHAELHQYKHQIELFSQLTQKLIKVYPTDDTSRIKRMTESVNLRYNNLNNGVINRGKLLHAAVHNLQSFDRTMDQFLAWLSEAESLCENAEQDIDRNPHALKLFGENSILSF